MKKLICLMLLMIILVLVAGCGEDDKVQSSATEATVASIPEDEYVDITKEYSKKPYSNDFALKRKEQLDQLNDLTICHISSDESIAQFYDGFFNEKGRFNVEFDNYNFDLNSETVKNYFDTWEYSRFANWGTTKVIDTFVLESDDKLTYYCYYISTVLGDNGSSNVDSYYYDEAEVNKETHAINIQQDIVIKKDIIVPLEISGVNDFSDVI